MRAFIIFMITFMLFNSVAAQQEIYLYKKIPNSKIAANLEKTEMGDDGILRISNVSVPAIYVFKPSKEQGNTGTAVIICPGGGYNILAIGHEGFDVAKKLNEWGITAFVLKYRIPNDRTMVNRSIGPLQDAERAVQWVREHAKSYGINTNKIGVMGFSAGGHLAASIATRYNEQLIKNPRHISFRPDFSILIYPVISFTDSLTHMGSRDNLIGKNPSEEMIKKYSCEMQVTQGTPPAFLVHAKDDNIVSYKNSDAYYNALLKNNIPAQIKYFEKGGHGFGMNNPTSAQKWMDDLKLWLAKMNYL